MVYISFLISHVPPAHSFFKKRSILENLLLEAVLNCLFEGLRVKNFSFDRFFQGR